MVCLNGGGAVAQTDDLTQLRSDASLRLSPVSLASRAIQPELVAGQPDHSQSDDGATLDPERWRLHSWGNKWDNDGTWAHPFAGSDEHYTNGAKIDLAWTPPSDQAGPEWWTQGEPSFGGGPWTRFALGISVEQLMFTPADITVMDPDPNERPYAGYAAIGFYAQRANDRVHDHAQLSLGIVGEWSGAELVQRFIHQSFPNQEDPRGWSTQLRNEPIANLRFARTFKTIPPVTEGWTLELLPTLWGDLGNAWIQAGAHMTLRVGPSLPDDFGPGRVLSWRDATGTGWHSDGWRWYAYTRVGVRGVARNITLDGNTWKDSRSVNREPWVGDAEVGFRARWDNLELGYQINLRTSEYNAQNGTDSYGEITLTWYF